MLCYQVEIGSLREIFRLGSMKFFTNQKGVFFHATVREFCLSYFKSGSTSESQLPCISILQPCENPWLLI